MEGEGKILGKEEENSYMIYGMMIGEEFGKVKD